MNAKRRKLLTKVIFYVDSALSLLDEARDYEQDALDSIPENLQDGELYEKIEQAIENLDSAIDSLSDGEASIRNAME